MIYANLMTPRSGSTLIQLMMFYYLKGKYEKTINLKNYFNKYHYNMFFTPITNEHGRYVGKENHTNYVEGAYREDAVLDGNVDLLYNYDITDEPIGRIVEEETLYRLNCLRDSDPDWTYCFKLHSFPELEAAYEVAREDEWKIVCTEGDPFQQTLEYFISMKMQIWAFFECTSESIVEKLPEAGSIKLLKRDLDSFLDRIAYYRQVRDSFENKLVIQLSDIEALDSVWDAYSLLGFDDWEEYIDKDEVLIELPVKIPFQPLESYFSNADKIQEWYEKWEQNNPTP